MKLLGNGEAVHASHYYGLQGPQPNHGLDPYVGDNNLDDDRKGIEVLEEMEEGKLSVGECKSEKVRQV